MRQRLFEGGGIIVLILELAREVVGVGLHVEMAVAGEVEKDRRRCALLARLQRLVDRRADCVGRFWRRDNSLDRANITPASKHGFW